MKKTFKRFLTGAAVTIFSVAAMAIGMTSGVYAAENVKTYTFGTNNATLETDSKDFFTITAASKKEEADYTALPKNSTISFTIPDDATKISIVANGKAHSSSSEQTIKLKNSVSSDTGAQSKMSASTGNPVDVTWKESNYATGENTVKCTGAEIDYYYIKVTYTTPDATDEPTLLPEGKTTTDGGAVYAVGNATYLIGKVDNLDADTVGIAVGNLTAADTGSDTVYTSVVVTTATGTEEITAEDLGASYLYAIKIGNSTDDRLKGFTVEAQ